MSELKRIQGSTHHVEFFLSMEHRTIHLVLGSDDPGYQLVVNREDALEVANLFLQAEMLLRNFETAVKLFK